MAYTTIDDPSAHFQVHYWVGTSTGDGVAQTLGGNSDLQPDLVWHKHNGSSDHALFTSSLIANDDANTSNTIPVSNRSQVPYNNSGDVDFSSFDSDGFTLDSSSQIDTATSNGVFTVNWCWKANGGTVASFSEVSNNPAGNRQVNTTAGFSIMTWTGTGVIDSGTSGTIAHGLGAVPHVILVKCRSNAHDWCVYHHENTAAPETDFLILNETTGTTDGTTHWNDTAHTTTNINLHDKGGTNRNDETHVGFVWTEIQGYSKFGSYTGNGNANGPFVYTGFSPAFIIIKCTSGSGQWLMFDNKRNAYNPTTSWFAAETSAAQTDDSNKDIDMLSNGFKARETGGDMNDDGGTYVYIAFAQQPVVTSTGVPATAR